MEGEGGSRWRAANKDVIMDGDDEAIGVLCRHRRQALLKSGCETQRTSRAALCAATAREEAHPAARTEGGDVGGETICSI